MILVVKYHTIAKWRQYGKIDVRMASNLKSNRKFGFFTTTKCLKGELAVNVACVLYFFKLRQNGKNDVKWRHNDVEFEKWFKIRIFHTQKTFKRCISHFHAIRIEGFKILVVKCHQMIKNYTNMAEISHKDVIMTSNTKNNQQYRFFTPNNC